ncbi:hypothetical protein ABKY54_004539 [Vibrio harveyi]
MALDIETIMSAEHAVTSSGLSENTFLVNEFQGVNLGVSAIPFFARVDVAFAGLTTLNIQVVGSDDKGFSNRFVIEESGPIPVADLKKGYTYKGRLNHHKPCKYIAFYYKVDGTGTAGKLTAAFSLYNEYHAGNYKSAGKVTIN